MSGRPNKHDFTFNSNYQFALDQWVTELESTITTQSAALRLAVEVLESWKDYCVVPPVCEWTSEPLVTWEPEDEAALTACREAITFNTAKGD